MSSRRQSRQPGHYSVLQTDPATGVPLAADGSWAAQGEGFRRAFDSLADAERFCAAQIATRPDTEWWIYDERDAMVRTVRDDEHWSASSRRAPT